MHLLLEHSIIENYFTLLKGIVGSSSKEIDELASFVDYKHVTLLNLRTTEKLIVADLKENLPGFEKVDNLKLIFYLNNNEIVRSNIVSFKNKVNYNDYTSLISSLLNLNGKNTTYSGRISFYSTTDRLITMFSEFESGNLKTSGITRPKSGNVSSGRVNECLDW